MATQQPEVIIAGGSLGGLSTALFLRDIGCKVTVLERSAETLIGRGAGIVLSPYTVRYFTEKGSEQLAAFSQMSVVSKTLRYMDSDGQIVSETPVPYRFSSYNAIYKPLLVAFGMDDYHLSAEMVNFEQKGDRVRVHLADGRQMSADMLVCADGVRSTGRRLLMPEVEFQYAGYVAWRGILDEDELPKDVFDMFSDTILYHIMPDSHLLVYPIPVVDRDPEAGVKPYINWLWYRNIPEGEALDNLMVDRKGRQRSVSLGPGAVQQTHIDAMRADGANILPGPLLTLVNNTKEPFIQAVMDAEVDQMVFGRVCIMGDGAFAARPHAAAGTAKATEDGWQLAVALKETGGDVPKALELWNARQVKMGQGILERSREAGRRFQVEGTWKVGDPLPFGLYEIGDSEMA
ncbi:MAG: FAD-dependent monooxygenase [Chloroflexota bacterium]